MSGNLLHAMRRHCDQTSTAPSTFGRQAVNDPRLVFDLRAGRMLRAKTAERIRQYMEATR
jgi:hypothetical protein